MSFIINKEACLRLKKGGTKQGDSLSPFLFLLVSIVLSALVVKLHQIGLFEGFVVGKENIHVSILKFADDTLLFCKYNSNMLFKLKHDH